MIRTYLALLPVLYIHICGQQAKSYITQVPVHFLPSDEHQRVSMRLISKLVASTVLGKSSFVMRLPRRPRFNNVGSTMEERRAGNNIWRPWQVKETTHPKLVAKRARADLEKWRGVFAVLFREVVRVVVGLLSALDSFA